MAIEYFQLIYLTELFLPRNEIIMAIRKKICTSPSSVHGCSSWLWENNYLTVHLTYTHPNLLFHWSLSPALPIVFRDKGIVISPSLLFCQPITNPDWNGCRSPPYNSHSQVTFSARKYLRLCWREGWGVDVVVLSTFWNTHILRDW